MENHELSSKTEKDIYNICKKYFELSLNCDKNKDLLKAFQNPENTVAFLTDGIKNGQYVWTNENGEKWKGCGMRLPKNTRVILDYEVSWPTLYFEKKEGEKETITIKESPLMIQAFTNNPSLIEQKKFNRREFLKEGQEVKVVLPFNTDDLKYYDAILVMPCFIPNKDMLTKVYFNNENVETDQPEIILTSC
ncbi:hypothetical protein [Aquimarina longa]|uniref:hypothetical protein n=1 Tax=Aquimarina longa TaxID=1080221 RepID=UPI0007833D0E|nr:hypothetical protein [Aquimarina longa]